MDRTRSMWPVSVWAVIALLGCVPQQRAPTPDNPVPGLAEHAASVSAGAPSSGGVCPAERPLDPRQRHPRIWLTRERIAEMRRQQKANTLEWRELRQLGEKRDREVVAAAPAALIYALTGDRDAGKRAREIALAVAPSFSGESTDFYREDAQDLALVFDWVHDLLSADDKKTLVAAINRAAELHIQKAAGQGTDSDVVTGGAKTNLLAALATLGDNPRAPALRQDSLLRWDRGVQDWLGGWQSIKNTFIARSAGGIWMEGSQYSSNTLRYVLEMAEAERNGTGRDLLCELRRDLGIDFARETVLAATQLFMPGRQDGFSWGDNQFAGWPMQFERWAGVLPIATDRLRGTPEGRWGQYLMHKMPTNVSGINSPVLAAMRGFNLGPHAFPFFRAEAPSEDLMKTPLTYVARGPGWVFARTSNDPGATGALFQGGSMHRVDHVHFDTASFQIYRKGEWLTRETRGYGLWSWMSRAHNTILLDHTGPQEKLKYVYGEGRLAATCTTPEFVFAASDATNAYNIDRRRNRDHGPPEDSAREVTREFLFHRGTGWVVVFDRLEVLKDSQSKELVFQAASLPQLGRDTIVTRSIKGSHLSGDSRREGKQQLRIQTVFPRDGLTYTLVDGEKFYAKGRPELGVGWPASEWEVPPFERRWHVLARLPGKARREVALHVLTGVDEGDTQPVVEARESAGKKGVRVSKGKASFEVLFDESGAVGGTFKGAGAQPIPLTCK